MIYKPYNVYPHNNSIDASKRNVFSFIFSGDALTYMDYHFYDASNNSLVRKSYVPLKFQSTFNNYEKKVSISPNTFENGKKYKYKMNLYQAKADIFVVQGTIRSIPEVSLSDTQIPISYGITEIENPIHHTVDGTDTIFGACYMEINDGTNRETRRIENYNPELKYGTDDGYGNYDYRTYVTLASPFSVKPTAGTTYKIFKNYITTPEYYFECYRTPVILPEATLEQFGIIKCTSDYYQEQGVSVKSYQYSLYKSAEDSVVSEATVVYNENSSNDTIYLSSIEHVKIGQYIRIYYTDDENGYEVSETRIINWYSLVDNHVTVSEAFSFVPTAGMSARIYTGTMLLVSESPIIYNQSLEYNFNNIIRDVNYRIVLKITTQANTTVENEITGIFQSISTNDNSRRFDCFIDQDNNDIRISYNIFKPALIEREDLNTLETDRIIFGYQPSHDYLVASNKSYRYNLIDIVQVDGEWKYGSKYTSQVLNPIWCNWTIYGLEQTRNLSSEEPNRTSMRVTGLWKLYIDVEEGEIVQNLNHYTHTGYYSKPKITTNSNNYISGSLICSLAQINPVDSKITDDIYKLQEWRKFISENEMFLLKNPKGDVWVVSITDNPTTKYDYSNKLMQTTINFAFTECMDLKDIAIIN